MNGPTIPSAATTRTAGALNVVLPSLTDRDTAAGRREEILPPDAEMTELTLLLPTEQAAALERASHRRGLTAGQLLRCLVREYLAAAEG